MSIKERHPEFLAERKEPLGAEEKSGVIRRMCTELVAEVLRDILGKMEESLQKDAGSKGPFLQSIIPTDVDLPHYALDALIKQLQCGMVYTRIKEPLSIRLVVALPEPCPLLKPPNP